VTLAWVAALVLLALAEVATRLSVIMRGRMGAHRTAVPRRARAGSPPPSIQKARYVHQTVDRG